jgi:hypothetical protein
VEFRSRSHKKDSGWMMTPSNTPNDREVLVCCEGANAAISLIKDDGWGAVRRRDG